MPTNSESYLTQLHQQLAQHFDLEELHSVCFELDIDYENLRGERKSAKVWDLLLKLGRDDRLAELIILVQKERPYVIWSLIPDDFELPESLGEAQPKVWDGRIPYIGLESFKEHHAQFFFGRESIVNELLVRVQKASFISITGPSGSGKSSIIGGGLFHALKTSRLEGSNTWLRGSMQPKNNPVEELARMVERIAMEPGKGNYLRREGMKNPLALHQQIETLLSSNNHQRCIILVDQFEEIFTQTENEDIRTAFIKLLTTSAQLKGGRTIILVCLRTEFLSHCSKYTELNSLINQQFLQVPAMETADLDKAITLPAVEVGVTIDPELVARIISDMEGEPGTLPLMSFTLRDLFLAEKTSRNKPLNLTLAGYVAHDGIVGALERHANHVLAIFTDEQKLLARSIFSKLIKTDNGTNTRRTVLLEDLIVDGATLEAIETIVDVLAAEETRLITKDTTNNYNKSNEEHSNDTTVTIAHEKLIDAWSWLRLIVDENREIIVLQNKISDDAQAWLEGTGFLYQDEQLLQIKEQMQRLDPPLGQLSQKFIQASLDLEQKKFEDKEAQRRQTIRILSTALSVTLILAAIAIFFFLNSNNNAQIANENLVTATAALILAETANADAILQRNEAVTSAAQALISEANALVAGTAEGRALATSNAESTRAFLSEGIAQAEKATAEYNEANALAAGTAEGRALATSNAESTRAFLSEGIAQAEKATAEYNADIAATREQEAIISAQEANRQRQIVFSQSLAAQSSSFLEQENNTELAALLAIEAAHSNVDNKGEIDWLSYSRLYDALDAPYFNNSLLGHEGNVNAVAFNPDATWLASAGAAADPTVRLWNLEDSATKPIVLHEHELGITGIVFSPDGNWLISGGADGTVVIWNFKEAITNQNHEVIRLPGDDYINAITISPDGKWLVSVDEGDSINVWNFNQVVSNTSSIDVIKIPIDSEVLSVAFNPSGTWLASGNNSNTINLWDFTAFPDGEIPSPKELHGHDFYITALAFSPNGNWLASGSGDTTVRLWEMNKVLNDSNPDSIVLDNYSDHEFITSLSFSPDGIWLATGAYSYPIETQARAVWLWNIGEVISDQIMEPIKLMGHSSSVNTVLFNPTLDIMQLASGSRDASVRLWSFDRAISRIGTLLEQDEPIASLTFSSNEQWLAAGVGDGGSGGTYLWDIRKLIRTLQVESIELTNQDLTASSVAFNPNSTWLLSGLFNGDFRFSNISETIALPSKVPTEVSVHIEWFNKINSMLFSDNGEWLITGNTAGNVLLWDTDDLYNPTSFSQAPKINLLKTEGAIFSVTKSSDETWLASSGEDGLIRIWDMNKVINGSSDEPMIIDGHHNGAILSITFSTVGSWLASSGQDGKILLWDADTLNPNSEPKRIIETGTEIRTLSISSNGKWLAGGSSDSNLYLWDFNNIVEDHIAEPIILAGGESLTFSPDGMWIVSGGSDGKIHLWPTPDNLIKIGCTTIRRNFTWSEWQRYMGLDVPYNQTCANLLTPGDVPG